MSRERELAETILSELNDETQIVNETLCKIRVRVEQFLSQPEREAGKVVRRMRELANTENLHDGYQPIFAETLAKWADALEASQARVAELEAQQCPQ